ncbi:MAG: oligoendopeptidase F [Synergistaceae bacterium]|jgi:oligoendopeptidase F|nr:oligoendopeptidase F [Synergistaceae bacterium]
MTYDMGPRPASPSFGDADLVVAFTGGEVPPRSAIPEEFKWRLSDIYTSDAGWEEDCLRVRAALPELAAMRGTLGESAANILRCLRLQDEISMTLGRLYAYAHMKSHEDTSDSVYQALSDRATTLSVEVSAVSSFITPELISIPEGTLNGFISPENAAPDENFDDYRFAIREVIRLKEHVLSDEEESLLAKAGDMASVPDNAFSMLTNADMKFPTIKDEDGNDVELTDERYIKYISSRNRSVRKSAFEALYETYGRNKNTLGATFNGMLKASRFYADARRYDSDLASALNGPNVPISVYSNLVDAIESRLAPLHRYMALRKRVLGLDELHMYDVYTPLVENPYRDISWNTAKQMVTEALGPLGPEYMAEFVKGLGSGWIDVCSNKGKRGGAYSWGTYGVHPYILLNYNGELSDVMTLAHEMGHAMHSYYSMANQPYRTSDYTIFCAEVASTTNEELTLDFMLRTTPERDRRIYLLNTRLERIRATVYRQVMFASFEREAHERGQRGENTTSDELGRIWSGLNAKYFGPEMVVDDLISLEWSRIPHFYSPFYVYQYATGYSAAAAIAGRITTEGPPARERYIRFLSSGGSDYPIELLKIAGVDMSTPGPIYDAINLFSETLDEMERLLEETASTNESF